jgi:hypothetical protein
MIQRELNSYTSYAVYAQAAIECYLQYLIGLLRMVTMIVL